LQAQVIAIQNDLFRRALADTLIMRKCYDEGITGNVVFSNNMAARSVELQNCALQDVAAFTDFNADNDPSGDHSFGVFTVGKRRLFFKIDLYDLELDQGSELPYDPACTERILTIMDPEEY
ncbi:MAG: DUF3768 domain-containing protein, partial [Pseudomonadota bacterium]